MLTIVLFNNDGSRDSEFSQLIDSDGIDLIIVNGQDRYQAYNSVLNKVSTEYVWFVDGSIRVTKKDLEKLVSQLSISAADFCAFDYIARYSDGSYDVCHSNMYGANSSQLVTMFFKEKHALFISSMIFRYSIIRDNSLSFCSSAGMYAQKLFVIEYLILSKTTNYIRYVVATFDIGLSKGDYCKKPEYTKQRLEQYTIYYERLKRVLPLQDVLFLEDDCFLFKDECAINGVISKMRFNSVMPLPYAAIKRNAWSYGSLRKLTLVYILNKFI